MFGFRENLKKAGILPPIDAKHHVRIDEHVDYRVG
jgi:predicted SPOUT superfamily RNA methylase MTH1